MLVFAAIYTGVTPGGGVRDPGGSRSIKASETSTRFHSLSQEPYSAHRTIDQAGDCLSTTSHANAMGFLCYAMGPLCYSEELLAFLALSFQLSFPWTFPGLVSIGYIGFPYNKLQTSITPEPLGPQRPNLAWKYI